MIDAILPFFFLSFSSCRERELTLLSSAFAPVNCRRDISGISLCARRRRRLASSTRFCPDHLSLVERFFFLSFFFFLTTKSFLACELCPFRGCYGELLVIEFDDLAVFFFIVRRGWYARSNCCAMSKKIDQSLSL